MFQEKKKTTILVNIVLVDTHTLLFSVFHPHSLFPPSPQAFTKPTSHPFFSISSTHFPLPTVCVRSPSTHLFATAPFLRFVSDSTPSSPAFPFPLSLFLLLILPIISHAKRSALLSIRRHYSCRLHYSIAPVPPTLALTCMLASRLVFTPTLSDR